MNKTEQIILAALKLISEKGYDSTSVQDIATSCGISKGSFYKHFSSKEDLLIEVFRYNHYEMFTHSKKIEMNEDLSVKEKLIKVLAFEIEVLYKNRDLFLLLHKVVPQQENEKFKPVLKKTRMMMIQSHKEWLLAVYGNEVQGTIWDLVLVLQGMMKELIVFLVDSISMIDKEEAAKNIIDRLDILASHKNTVQPLLPKKVMTKYEEVQLYSCEKTKHEEWQELLLYLKDQIQDIELSRSERCEVMETLTLLEKESLSESPRAFLMKALLSHLKAKTRLVDSLSLLERFIEMNDNYSDKEGV